MVPLAFTSSRKFALVTVCPDCNLVWLTSDELTEPLPLVSPTRTAIGMATSPIFVPVFTLDKVTDILCALVTPVKLTVTAVVPLPVTLLTIPMPDVIAALLRLTALEKRMTI